MLTIHLSSIGHVHGDRHAVRELTELDPAAIGSLADEVVSYRASDSDVWELAAGAAEHTLQLSPAAPDLIIYVTESDANPSGSLARIADLLGLRTAAHLVISGHDCGNLGPSLQVATDTLVSGRCHRILLLVADRARPGRRIMPGGQSVFSDGAAGCIVTRDEPSRGNFVTVDAISTKTEVPAGGADSAEDSILATVRLAADSLAEVLHLTTASREDFRHLIFANYRIPVQKFLTSAMKYPAEKLLIGPVSDYGHCFSADLLVTFDCFLRDGTFMSGDRILATAIGPSSWSTMAVTCTVRTEGGSS